MLTAEHYNGICELVARKDAAEKTIITEFIKNVQDGKRFWIQCPMLTGAIMGLE